MDFKSVYPSVFVWVTLENFKSHHKMSLTKVLWYVLNMKNMHFGSPSDSWHQCGKAKLSYAQYIIRQGKAELHILELTLVFHHLPSVSPKQLCALAHLGFTREAGTSWFNTKPKQYLTFCEYQFITSFRISNTQHHLSTYFWSWT